MPIATVTVPLMPTTDSSASPSVPDTVCCVVVVPAQLIAMGRSGLSPDATRRSASSPTSTAGTVSTRVPGAAASASASPPTRSSRAPSVRTGP